MINKVLFIGLFFSLIGISGNGQSKMEDVVYLKNGGVTRGMILEIIPERTVKIQTQDRDIFVHKFSEIERMEKINFPKTYATKVDSIVKPQLKQAGYYNISKLGPMGLAGYTASSINGYRFNPHLLIGLGIGLDVYRELGGNNDIVPYYTGAGSRSSDYFLPVFIDARYHIRGKSATTFFTFFQMGYSVYLGGKSNNNQDLKQKNNYNYSSNYSIYNSFIPNRGGTFICTGGGLKIFANKKMAIITDFGIKLQNYSVTEYSSSNPGEERQSILIAISPFLNLGVAF
jgi:hypothetical protein